jgi:hypothetical protein
VGTYQKKETGHGLLVRRHLVPRPVVLSVVNSSDGSNTPWYVLVIVSGFSWSLDIMYFIQITTCLYIGTFQRR